MRAICAVTAFVLSLGHVAASPAFKADRSLGFTMPFNVVLRSPMDDQPSSPFYLDWSKRRDHATALEYRKAGFETIRLPVDPLGLLKAEDEHEREAAVAKVGVAIDDLVAMGYRVVLDLHVEDSGPDSNSRVLTASLDDPKFKTYVSVVSATARLVARYEPAKVALELFNEPPPPCRGGGRPPWREFQKVLYSTARAAAPRTTLVLTGPCYGSVEGIGEISAADYDANTIFTIHFYEPPAFTYQGAYGQAWGPKFVHGVPYPPQLGDKEAQIAAVEATIDAAPGLADKAREVAKRNTRKALTEYFDTPMDRAYLARKLQPALDWADRNGVERSRIWVGEFGTWRDAYGLKAAAKADRVRWFKDARELFEQAGITWSAWGLHGGMGISTADKSGPPDPDIAAALGLRP